MLPLFTQVDLPIIASEVKYLAELNLENFPLPKVDGAGSHLLFNPQEHIHVFPPDEEAKEKAEALPPQEIKVDPEPQDQQAEGDEE